MPPLKKKLNLTTDEVVQSIEEQAAFAPVHSAPKVKASSQVAKKDLTITQTRRMTEKQIKEYMKTL